MNALTVLCLAAAVACSTSQLVAFPGGYPYPGVLGAYPGFLPSAAPYTLKAGAPSHYTLQAVSPSQYTLQTGAPSKYTLQTGAPSQYILQTGAPSQYTLQTGAPSQYTLQTGAPSQYTLQTVAPSPITYKTVAPASLTFKTVTTEPITIKAASPVAYSVPQVAPVAPFAPVQTQFHAQDELGQYSFGYSGGPSSRAETRDAFGRVRGSFNYIDSEGKLQTQNYVADALGFRVAGTDLPVAPEAPEAPALVGPEPVQDTLEVAAAKATFRSLLEKAAATPDSPETTAEAAPESRKKRAVVAQAPFPYVSPLRFSYGYTAPLAYSHPLTYSHPLAYSAAFPAYTGAPAATAYTGVPAVTAYTGAPVATTYVAAPAAARDATLLQVVHNPGHSVSYRVD